MVRRPTSACKRACTWLRWLCSAGRLHLLAASTYVHTYNKDILMLPGGRNSRRIDRKLKSSQETHRRHLHTSASAEDDSQRPQHPVQLRGRPAATTRLLLLGECPQQQIQPDQSDKLLPPAFRHRVFILQIPGIDANMEMTRWPWHIAARMKPSWHSSFICNPAPTNCFMSGLEPTSRMTSQGFSFS